MRIVAAIGLALFAAAPAAHPQAQWAPERLVVVDGDTLRLGSEKIRIIGVDTPEIGSHAHCGREFALGMRASEVAAALVAQGNVAIERKHRRDGSVSLDRYSARWLS